MSPAARGTGLTMQGSSCCGLGVAAAAPDIADWFHFIHPAIKNEIAVWKCDKKQLFPKPLEEGCDKKRP